MATSYNHTQTTPSSTWTIVHNLNTNAINIDVVVLRNGVYGKIIPTGITTPDTNTAVITFTTTYTGSTRVVGTADSL